MEKKVKRNERRNNELKAKAARICNVRAGNKGMKRVEERDMSRRG